MERQDMDETILKLAGAISGAGEAEQELLAMLCAAAERAWTARLRDGVTAGDCGAAFCCAAAFTAAADMAAGRGGGAVSAFTAGEVSISAKKGSERAESAAELRRTAERLMADYVSPGDLCLRGVRG